MVPAVPHLQILMNLPNSDHLESILSHLSQAVINAAHHSHPHHWLLSDLLGGLVKWISPPTYLMHHAYGWCSAICEKNEDLGACKDLLMLALQLGFRQYHIYPDWIQFPPVHTEYHKRMIDVVFSIGDIDTVADALCAWTLGDTPQLRFPSLGACADHIVSLPDVKSSQRLRHMVIHAIECIGYPEFERVGVQKLVPLLNGLKIEVHEMEWRSRWMSFLWSVLRSPPGQQYLSPHYWQCIVPMAMQPGLFALSIDPSDLEIMKSFEEAGDWEKLEVWIGMMWILELPEDMVQVEVEEVKQVTQILFYKHPNALKTVEGWVLGVSEERDSLSTRHEDTSRWYAVRQGRK